MVFVAQAVSLRQAWRPALRRYACSTGCQPVSAGLAACATPLRL